MAFDTSQALSIQAARTIDVGRGNGGGGAINLPQANLVVDTFESADFSTQDSPSPSLNTAAFEWYNLTRFSIVRSDGYVVYGSSGPINTGPLPEREWSNGPGLTGTHSMRARYAASQEMTEISFRFGSYYTELWFRYWIKVPINYLNEGANNKWFSIFPTRADYDRAGTLTIQTRGDGGNGGARLVYQDGGVTSGETGHVDFISVPADRGRWMQLVYRFKRASTASANDGVYQCWRRWENEESFSLLHSKLDAQLYNTDDPNGFRQGYLLGWANVPFVSDTEFLIDDFEISDQPLVPAGTEGL